MYFPAHYSGLRGDHEAESGDGAGYPEYGYRTVRGGEHHRIWWSQQQRTYGKPTALELSM